MSQELKQVVTKDMTIADVVRKYPQAGMVMTAHGLHCVGCGVSPIETVEAGCKGHGWTDEQIDAMLAKVNEAIGASGEQPLVTITDKAAAKLKEIAASENKSDHGVRIQVMPAGCSGNAYSMDFDKEQSGDTIEEVNGIKVFVDTDSINLLRGSVVDYIETPEESGFKIENLAAKKGCGC